MKIEELSFEISLVENEAADDWIRAGRLNETALLEMENTELVSSDEKEQ